MFREDYVLRMISQAMTVLAQVMGLRKANQNQEAIQAVDQALEILLGLRAGLLKQMSDENLFHMLSFQGRLDTARAALVADLFKEAGQIYAELDQPAESFSASLRALVFYMEVAMSNQAISASDYALKINSLYEELKSKGLPLETRLALSNYYEALLEKDDLELTSRGTDRAQIEERLNELAETF